MNTCPHAPLLGNRNYGDAKWFAPFALRSAKLAERVAFAWDIAEALAPEVAFVSPGERLAADLAVRTGGAFCSPAGNFALWGDWDWDGAVETEADGLWDDDRIVNEAGVNTYNELAQLVSAQIAEALADELDAEPWSPWGDVFDPDDLQWGFTVRTRF